MEQNPPGGWELGKGEIGEEETKKWIDGFACLQSPTNMEILEDIWHLIDPSLKSFLFGRRLTLSTRNFNLVAY